MAYSDFSLKKAKSELSLEFIEEFFLFSDLKPIEISAYLAHTLKRNVPLAFAINTEKARSELIIINILLEIKEQLHDKISLFSGIDFTVDKEKGLNGFCDYIISASKEQLYLESPVITVVEAKNENIIGGLGQCIAEMVAAKIYNDKEQLNLPAIYGAVTTGDEWKFLKLKNSQVFIDRDVYYISDINKIMAIFIQMLSNPSI